MGCCETQSVPLHANAEQSSIVVHLACRCMQTCDWLRAQCELQAAHAQGTPLHLAAADVAADKVLAVPQEHAVAYGVDVGWQEVCDARVAGVLAVVGDRLAHQLVAHLHDALAGCKATFWGGLDAQRTASQ